MALHASNKICAIIIGIIINIPHQTCCMEIDCDNDKEKTEKLQEALDDACNDGKIEEVRRLLNSTGINVNACFGIAERTPLMRAAHKHLDIVRCLVDEYSADVNICSPDGTSALQCADDLEIVRFLVEHDAKINVRFENNFTILMLKSMKDYLAKVVQYLVEHGADIYAKDIWGRTALNYTKRISPRIAKYLTGKMTAWSALHALLTCDELIKDNTDAIPHGNFPPEDIDRILKPCIAAALAKE